MKPRRPTGPRVALLPLAAALVLSSVPVLSTTALLSLTAACSRSRPQPGSGSERAPASEGDGLAPGEPGEADPPSRSTLTDPRYSPYQHNPVSWRFVNTRVENGGERSDVRVAMTTTPERVVLEGLGLLFKLVLEIQFPTPDGTSFESDFRSHVALLTPEGLYLSEPNLHMGDLRPAAAALAAELLREEPSWPLPGSLGCTHRVRDVSLPFGAVRGVETHCPALSSPFGRADVRTLWAHRVGFVYREVRPLEGDLAGLVLYDVLASGDLTELAPEAGSAGVEPLGP
jgi:hypothetical protein